MEESKQNETFTFNDMKIMSFNCKHFYDSGLKFDFINKYIYQTMTSNFYRSTVFIKVSCVTWPYLELVWGLKLKVPWMNLYLRKGGSMGAVPYCESLMSKM